MFSKNEKKQFNEEFWNAFGLYMKKYNQRLGRVRWVNYRSNVKDVFFRLDISPKRAKFSIEIQHADEGIRALFYEQFLELKAVIERKVGKDLIWEDQSFNNFNQPACSISCELENVSVYKKEDWQKTFQFFEKKMVGLHKFWEEFQEIFKNLEK
jgi:hypothetical protein